MPAVLGVRALVALQVRRLLRRRELRGLLRIEAHGDDVELLANAEFEHAERARQAVQHLRAEHRALVIHEREDHRPLAEEVAEPHVAAGFILEWQFERHLRVQLLVEADLGQQLGQFVGRRLGR